MDREGHVVGCHRGYAYYTIGQKRGLETSLPNVAVVSDRRSAQPGNRRQRLQNCSTGR
ncbi:MAG: tRNA methyl transferase PRC-barrel domain-containing protein [Alistipes indistinctus]